VKAWVVVVRQAARLIEEEMPKPRQPVPDGEDLVDLLLILGDDDRGL